MNKEKKSILLAVSLGDGCIGPKNSLYIEHSINQLEFIKWKKELLEKILNRKINLRIRERFDTRTNKTYKSAMIMAGNKYFKIIKRWLYKPEKTYSRFVLNRLTPLGIAIWYMDDGGCKFRISKKTNKVSSIQLSLYAYCSYNEAVLIQEYFQEVHNIFFQIYERKDKKCVLCANTANGNKFIELVRPYMIPSMMYKIDINSKSAKPLIEGEDIV